MSAEPTEEPRVIIRDRRKLDPETGALREPAPTTGSGEGEAAHPAPAADPELTELVAERTADLQRLKAEYDNYRRRTERDRASDREASTAKVLAALLPTLDDLARAEQHGDLTGSFRSVAEGLVRQLESLGLERYGDAGEAFDPYRHEALVMVPTPGLSASSVVDVMRAGYAYAGRVVRPAQVAVGEPVEQSEAVVEDLA